MKKLPTFIFVMQFLLFSIFSNYSFSLERQEIADSLEDSTIRISLWGLDDKGQRTNVLSGGSGVIINKRGTRYFALTNAHVVLKNFCFLNIFKDQKNTNCKDEEYDYSENVLLVDNSTTEYEYKISEILWWSNLDLAVIAFESQEDLKSIQISNQWYSLMEVYAAGFPFVMGNQKPYRNLFLTSGSLNTVLTDKTGELQAQNYTLVHDATISGGMSGGPLVDKQARLLGINGLGTYAKIQSFDPSLVDTSSTRYHYSIHYYDFMVNVILDKKDNFNNKSYFFEYAPKLSKVIHQEFYNFLKKEFPKSGYEIEKLFN